MKVKEKKLLHFYRDMAAVDQHALLRYAEFLFEQQKAVTVDFEIEAPKITEAAENETVVGALKRLSASYPMLDKSKMLDETSALMSDHLLKGKSKEDVIVEFNLLFEEQYKKLRDNKSND